jgi:hypothetical protein
MKEGFRAKHWIGLLFFFMLIFTNLPCYIVTNADANQSVEEFPLGLVVEYEKQYKHMSSFIDETYTVRFEVTDRVEGYESRYVVVRTIEQDDGTTVDTFQENYPNGNLAAHESAPLWINLSSWENLDKVTLGWRVYNITSYSSGGCGLHHEEGDDEDTIVYESHGLLASGYFFHFNIDDPFGTNSLSTKLVSSNVNPTLIPFASGWLLTAFLIPAIAFEVVIIAALIKRRRIQTKSNL